MQKVVQVAHELPPARAQLEPSGGARPTRARASGRGAPLEGIVGRSRDLQPTSPAAAFVRPSNALNP